jgi:poly(hydroxyalkanoate) depolymerase family esterase
MASLEETIASLLRHGRDMAKGETARPMRLSEGEPPGVNPGNLRMFAYRPENLAKGAATVVVLHGCGQSAAFADAVGWAELADRMGFAVLAPQQRTSNNTGRCFNWFQPADISRGSGEVASIANMTQAFVQAFDGDPAKVFVTGLSAGGAMATAMLAAYPEIFAAGAVLSGIPYRAAENVTDGFRAMGQGPRHLPPATWAELVRSASSHDGPWPRLSIWQGNADRVVHPANAASLAGQWAALHGLAETPTQVEHLGARRRSVWGGAQGPLLELHLIDGLGHGAPIAGGPEGLGRAQEFVLEAGVDSTLEIARFWGLDAAPARRRG